MLYKNKNENIIIKKRRCHYALYQSTFKYRCDNQHKFVNHKNVQLSWELVTVKAIACDLHHFHPHQSVFSRRICIKHISNMAARIWYYAHNPTDMTLGPPHIISIRFVKQQKNEISILPSNVNFITVFY